MLVRAESCVRRMAQVITAEDADGGRACAGQEEVGGTGAGEDERHGRTALSLEPGLCRAEALADGNRTTPRPKARTGAKAVMAGFGPHGVAVTDRTAASSTPNRPAPEVDLPDTTPT